MELALRPRPRTYRRVHPRRPVLLLSGTTGVTRWPPAALVAALVTLAATPRLRPGRVRPAA